MTAKSRFDKLHSARSQVIERARRAAELTIPSICPPEGSDENTILPTPYQSLGARGVNNIASKLLITLFPADTPFFKFTLKDAVIDAIGENRDVIDEQLRRLENKITREVEANNIRVSVFNSLKHLVVTGNALLYKPQDENARMFKLSQYVVVRDPSGTVMEIVIKEVIHPDTLSEDIQEQISNPDDASKKKTSDTVELYTHVTRADNKVVWHQEINDIKIEGTEGRVNYDDSPFVPLRWNAIENEDYGRGLVEEYLGDLISLEGLTKAVVSFAAIAARILFLEHPNSTTDTEQLTKAESGDVVEGNINDIDILQLDKYPDFQVAKGVIDDLSLRLSHAFLLRNGTTRNAERVTAEEIRADAQELEDVLGGVYTVQSTELQLPLVRIFIAQSKKAGDFPKLNGGELDPTIITGFDALGRGHTLNRLRQFFQDQVNLFGPDVMGQYNAQAVGKRFATAQNVDITDLLKSPEQLASEQEQARNQALAEKAAAPVASAAAQAALNTEE